MSAWGPPMLRHGGRLATLPDEPECPRTSCSPAHRRGADPRRCWPGRRRRQCKAVGRRNTVVCSEVDRVRAQTIPALRCSRAWPCRSVLVVHAVRRGSGLIVLVVLVAWMAAMFVHESPRAEESGSVPCVTRVCEAPHLPAELCGVACGHPQHVPVVPSAVPAVVLIGFWLRSRGGLRPVFDLRRSSRLLRPPQLAQI